MASNLNEILGRNIDSVKSLKTAIRELQDSLVGLDSESQEYKDTAAKLIVAQDALKETTRAGVEANLSATDSIVGMQKEYNKLYDTYKKLSDEQRNSDFGKEMAKSLESLSETINKTKKDVGNFTSNIGHYAEGAMEAFNKMGISVGALKGPLDIAKNGTKGLNDMWKLISKNPWMTVLGVLVGILVKAAAAIKNNEKLTQRLHQAFAAFQPVLNLVSNAFDWLAEKIVKLVEGFAKLWEKIASLNPKLREQIKVTKELAAATDELNKKQREQRVINSQLTDEIEELRELASETENVTEKTRLLEEAKAKQQEIDQANLELAQENLRILKENAELTANSAEENDKLAEAEAAVSQASAELNKNLRRYNKEIERVGKTTRDAGKSVDEYKEKAKELYEQLVENNKDELTKITEKYETEKKLLVKYGYDTTLLTKKYQADVLNVTREAEDKAREARLKGLEQERVDLEGEWKMWRILGDVQLAAALEAEKIDKEVLPTLENFADQIDKIVKKEGAAWEKFVNKNGFSALGDEYKELKEAIEEANADFGLNITTIRNLEYTIPELKVKLNELALEYDEVGLSIVNLMNMDEELNMMMGGFDQTEILIERARNSYDYLQTEKKMLQENLLVWQDNLEKRIELTQRLYQVQEELFNRRAELEALDKQRTAEMVENLIDAADRMTSALGTWKSTREAVIDSEVRAGKISEDEAAKQKKRLLTLERLERDFAIATIVADAASGAFSIWKGYATEVGVINAQTAAAAGPGASVMKAALDAKSLISAIAKTAGLAATATAQIAAAQGKYVVAKNNMSAESGGGSVGVGATPALIETTPYSYSRTVQTQEEEDRLNTPIYVTVTDIEEGLGHRATVTNESSF